MTGSFIRRAAAFVGATTMVATLMATAAPADAAVVLQQGRAYSLAATGLVPIAPQQDTGLISRVDDYTTGPMCATTLPNPVFGGIECNVVATGAKATNSVARGTLSISSIATASLPVASLGTLVATGVTTFAGVQCSLGANGITNIATLRLGLRTLVKGGPPPAPNTIIPLGAGMIILNEQKPVPGATGIEVNAIHVIVPGVADVVVSSAMASLVGCPTTA